MALNRRDCERRARQVSNEDRPRWPVTGGADFDPKRSFPRLRAACSSAAGDGSKYTAQQKSRTGETHGTNTSYGSLGLQTVSVRRNGLCCIIYLVNREVSSSERSNLDQER
jgi:hypothetical protein